MPVKTAYVTGGASGIGRAVAEMLSRRGIRVAVADIDLQGAQKVAASLQGNNAVAVHLDAASWDSQLAAFKTVLNAFDGRIDYVLPIAGIGEKRWLPNGPDGEFQKPNLQVLDVDLNGVLYSVALAVQQMRRQSVDVSGSRGKIVAAASVCGFYCVPTLPVYTAAKHGVVGFVRSYGKFLPAESITLNAICPDVVKTNISGEAFYKTMESRELLVPMKLVLDAFERCLDSDISGETLEVEPHSGISHRSAPEPIDQDAADSMVMLHERGASLHSN